MTQKCEDEKTLGSRLPPVAQMLMEYSLTFNLIIKEID